MDDGIEIDIAVNKTDMDEKFANKRISRKAAVYKKTDINLNLYVFYYEDFPIGNYEFMFNNEIAKIEDFDILKKYQRMGFGTSAIKH